MEKYYYENPYKKEFTAEIINVLEKDNKYHVELDKTYFSPKFGAQPNDTGYINGAEVTYVYEAEDKIYHVIKTKPMKIHKVKCSIDWTKKFDFMQQHLGQHIISACFFELFNANTININLGNDSSYLDIDKIIGSEEIKKAEEMANNIVFDNISVEAFCPTKAELKKLSIKKIDKKSAGKARIVKIGDIDVCPCEGIHPNSTIEVQAINLLNLRKHETGSRIDFMCGSRAISEYRSKYESTEKISKLLRCSDSDVLNEIEKLSSELKTALAENSSLKTKVAEYEVQNMLNSCETIKDIRVLKSIYENVDLKYVNLLASRLTAFPNVIVLFAVRSEDKAQLIFMCSKDLKIASMNLLLKDAISLIDGNGGGSDFSAKGGGKNNNNLDSSLDYAYNKIKGIICS